MKLSVNTIITIEEDIAQITWLTKNINAVSDLITHYGENITLIDLFNKISKEKKDLYKDINKVITKDNL